MIVILDEPCPTCGAELGQIVGVLAKTTYCRNINCFYVGASQMTARAIELLA